MRYIRLMGLLGLAAGLMVLAAGLSPWVSADDGTLDDSSFTWTNQAADVNLTFAAGGAEPANLELPFARFDPGPTHDVTYKILGTGVTLGTQQVTTTLGGQAFTYSNTYYELGNGITYNFNGSGEVESSASTAAAAKQSYTWRAVSFHGKYSELNLSVTVNAALSIDQTSTTISLNAGDSADALAGCGDGRSGDADVSGVLGRV